MSRCLCRMVLCEVCGVPMLVGEYTESGVRTYHGATPANERVQAAHKGPWPTCAHGALYLSGCRNQPVPPVCCGQEPLHAAAGADARVPSHGQTSPTEM